MSDPSTRPNEVDPGFAKDLAHALRCKRRSLGYTLDQMVRRMEAFGPQTVDVVALEGIEAGSHPIRRSVLGALAESYEVELSSIGRPRIPVTITDHTFEADGLAVAWYSGHIDDVLVAFLELIRLLRGDAEVEVASLRRVDIEAISGRFHVPGDELVRRLGDLVGASVAQAASMGDMYSAGLDVIPVAVTPSRCREQDALDDRAGSRLAEMLASGDP